MNLHLALLDSWDRQCEIVKAVASLVTTENRHFRPADDGLRLDEQLAHIHGTRRFWLSQLAPNEAAALPSSRQDDEGTPLEDLDALRACLGASAAAVRDLVELSLDQSGPLAGGAATYDHPVLFLQHMVWHEGWHVGQIMTALRVNGQEPTEEWEETHLWGGWRTEVWE